MFVYYFGRWFLVLLLSQNMYSQVLAQVTVHISSHVPENDDTDVNLVAWGFTKAS